jgi:cell division septal protein FtsQ
MRLGFTRRWVLNIVSVALLLGAVFVPLSLLTWFIFFTHTFSVHTVSVQNARPDTTAAIEQLVHDQIALDERSRLKQTIFFVPTKVLERRIVTQLSSVQAVRVTRELPGTIKVVVQEKTPALLLLAANTYYFVDAEGIAYEQAKLENLPGIVIPTIKNKDTDANVIIASPVVSADLVKFVTAIQKELPNQIGAQVVDIFIPSLAAREVSFRLDNNWEIRFDTTRPAENQLSLLKQVLDTTIPPADKPSIEYIDLRIADRIYYKIRGSVF